MAIVQPSLWLGSVGKSHLPAEPICVIINSMKASISDNKKTRGRPVTTGSGTLVGVRLQSDALDQLDTWIAAQPEPRPGRPEAVRRLIDLGLKGAAMKLTEDSAALLRQVAEKSRLKSVSLPPLCNDLERAGFVTITAVNLQDMLVEITPKGRHALNNYDALR